MPTFMVNGYESISSWCYVEADNKEEAIEKAWRGECTDGTQDTDPGKRIWKSKWTANVAKKALYAK